MRDSTEEKQRNSFFKKQYLLIYAAVFSVLVVVAGYLYYSTEVKAVKKEKNDELHAITKLKSGQITQWIKERKADAAVISGSPFFIDAIEQWLNNRNTLRIKEDIIDRFIPLKENFGYEDILIASPKGDLLLSLDPEITGFDTATSMKIIEAVKKQEITLTDFYFCSTHNKVHLDIIAPVVSENDKPITVLVLRIDPNDYLYPLILSWPAPSDSAETLIVRRDNESVLFLNELRHRKNTALLLRIPLTEKAVPAVQAVTGTEGIIEGKDYRGVDVLADIQPVPGTPWFMIAKVDSREIFSQLYYRTTVTVLFSALLLILVGTGVAWRYRSLQRDIYKDLFLKEKELRETHEEFRTTLYSIGDAVITTDIKGNVRNINSIAEQLTGWKEPDARGTPLQEIFSIINEETRESVEDPVQRVLREGLIIGLANHTLLISKEGKEIPIADSGSPIRNEKGEIIGVVLVFQDQTYERAAQKMLKESEQRFRLLYEQSPAPYQSLDEEGNILDVNNAWLETLGYKRSEVIGKWFGDFLASDGPALFRERFSQFKSLGEVHGVEFEMKRKDGNTIIVSFEGGIGCNKKGDFLQTHCVFTNITERKRTEDALRKSEERFRIAGKAAYDLLYEWDVTSDSLEWFGDIDSLLGYGKGEISRDINAWLSLIHEEDRGILENAVEIHRTSTEPIKYEYRIRHKDGTYKYWIDHGLPLFDDKGRPSKWVGVCTDVTERKLAEETSKMLSSGVEQSTEGMAIASLEGNLIFVNKAWCRMHGYKSSDELIGKNLAISHTQEQLENEVKPFNEKVMELGAYSGEVGHITEDGRPFLTFMTTTLLKDKQGNPYALAGTANDITERKQAEKIFRDLSLKQEAILASVPDIIMEVDTNKVYTWANQAGKDFFGEDVIGKEASYFFEGEQKTYDTVQRLFGGSEDVIYVESWQRRKNGEKRLLAWWCKALKDENGNVTGAISTARDITERKRDEEKLFVHNKIAHIFLSIPDDEIFNEVLKVVLEAMQSPFGVFGYIDEDGALVVPTMTRQIWDKCQVPDKTFVFPRDKWGHSSWPKAIREKRVIYSNEPSIHIPQGHVGIQRQISLPIFLKEKVIGLFQVANKEKDYTQADIQLLQEIAERIAPVLDSRLKREQAEEAVKRTAKEWETTFDSTKELFMLLDKDYKIIRANKATSEFLGMPFEKIIGNYCFTLMHGTNEPPPECPLARLWKSRSHEDSELFIKEHNIWASVSVDPIFNKQGELVQIVHIIEDITGRKKTDEEIRKLNEELEQRVMERTAQLEAANKELESFSYSVSHDLRAPLRAIAGFSEILLRKYSAMLDDEGKRICSIISGNTQKMGQLIDEILALSRLGRTEMYLSSIDMKSMAKEVYNELTNPEMQKRIDIQLGDLPKANGDPVLLKQVWVNLISNSLKFTSHRKRGVISVTSRKDEDQAVYCVKDNGAGFNMKYKDKLFGVFQRLHSEKEFPGTGVGLAIVQRIVRRHGGEVWAEGEVNQGAEFCFSLPKRKG